LQRSVICLKKRRKLLGFRQEHTSLPAKECERESLVQDLSKSY